MSFYEEGLIYSVDLDHAVSQKNKLDFNPGFRIQFGHDHENVSLNVAWTYIRFKDESFSEKGTGGLLGTFLPPGTGALTDASARISGDFNTLDIDLSKPYHVSQYYIANPKIGLQAAWIDQDYHLRYFITNTKSNVYCKNDFWGVGLKAGYDADFILGKKVTFYANIASAILFSKFDISQNAHNTTINHYQLSDSFYKVLPNAQIGLGFTYYRLFHKNTIKAKLKIGYEFQQWWSINQLRRPMSSDPNGFKTASRNDLTFNGLVATINIDI